MAKKITEQTREIWENIEPKGLAREVWENHDLRLFIFGYISSRDNHWGNNYRGLIRKGYIQKGFEFLHEPAKTSAAKIDSMLEHIDYECMGSIIDLDAGFYRGKFVYGCVTQQDKFLTQEQFLRKLKKEMYGEKSHEKIAHSNLLDEVKNKFKGLQNGR